MEGILQVAEGFNDARLAALGELGARQRRVQGPRPKWRGARTGEDEGEEEDEDEQSSASIRTVMVLFLCGTLFLMHWRLSLSPQLEYLEKQRGHWLYHVKQILDTAACPECFDGSTMIPCLMVLYIWGRVIARVLTWSLVLGTLGVVIYPPYLCWDHRLPFQYDWGQTCRSFRPQCQALIDYREREGVGGGSDGHYAYLWKHGTSGALTQPEITHAKKTQRYHRIGLQKDQLHSALELGFDMPWYGKLYNRIQISANGYLVLLQSPNQHNQPDGEAVPMDNDSTGSANTTYKCCAPLDSIHTAHGEAVIAPYYTDLDPTIENMEGTSGVWAGQLEQSYSFGIYFNRVAAAHTPLEDGNRPNPKHTTSFQVIFKAQGAVTIYYHEANASSHGRPKHEGRGVFVGWRTPVDSSASIYPGGTLITAAAPNITHTVDEQLPRKSVLLNGCSVYALHFTPQELYDRKIYPVSVKPEDRQSESTQYETPPVDLDDVDKRVDPDYHDAADAWGDVAEGGSASYIATSAEGRRRRKQELMRSAEVAEMQAKKQAGEEKDEM